MRAQKEWASAFKRFDKKHGVRRLTIREAMKGLKNASFGSRQESIKPTTKRGQS